MSSSASKAVPLWRYTSSSSRGNSRGSSSSGSSCISCERAALPTQPKQTFKCPGKWQAHLATFSAEVNANTRYTHTHTHAVALTFTSIFTSSLPSTRNVNSVDSTHLSELRSSRRAPHPNPSSNPQSQFQFQLPPSPCP